MTNARISNANTEFLLGPESVVPGSPVKKYLRLVRRKLEALRGSGPGYSAEAFFTRPGFVASENDRPLTARNVLVAASTVPLVFVIAVLFVSATFGAPKSGEARIAAADDATMLAQPAFVAASEVPATGARGANLISQISANGVVIPEGFTPGAIALDGDRLAVRVDGPEGAQVLIYDLTMGGVIQTIPLGARASGAEL